MEKDGQNTQNQNRIGNKNNSSYRRGQRGTACASGTAVNAMPLCMHAYMCVCRACLGHLVRADDSEIVSACWRGHVAVARVSIYLAEAIKLVSCLIVIVCGAWRVAIVVVPCIVYILVAVAIMEVVTRSSIVSRREIFLRWPIASRRGIVVRGLVASRWAGAILVLGEFSHSLFLFNLSFQRSGIFLRNQANNTSITETRNFGLTCCLERLSTPCSEGWLTCGLGGGWIGFEG